MKLEVARGEKLVINGEVYKYCGRCKSWRTVDSFYTDRTKYDGKTSWCKDCERDYQRRRLLLTMEVE